MFNKTVFSIVVLLLVAGAAFSAAAPTGLMCELLAHPETTVFGDATPEFGWIVNSDTTDDVQTAYQVMVATSETLLGQDNPDMWNSGKTTGNNSVSVSYAGSALSANQTYFWKVRTWDKSDQASLWSAVQEIKTASSLSGYNTARYTQVASEVSPVRVTQIESGRYLIDFGKDAFGYIRWTLPQGQLRMGTANQTMIKMVTDSSQSQSQSGTTVTVHFGEKLENGQVDRSPGGTIRYYSKSVMLDGSESYEIHPDGTTRGIAIPAEFGRIAPFRYVELENVPVTVSTKDFKQVSVHYPFNDDAASFSCDNEALNSVWELCYYSMKPTSFCGVYVDGDRERKPYEADAYINQLCHYSADREFTMARYSTEYLYDNDTWPTEWKQHSIMMAWADYLYTGNTESLAEHYTQLQEQKLLYQCARSSDGLLWDTTCSEVITSSLDRDIVDWPSGERDGYDTDTICDHRSSNRTIGLNTVVNAFYYHTLKLMQQIAETLSETADAAQYEQDAAEVYQAFQDVLYNSSTGLYIDGLDENEDPSTHSSLHANMWPLAFGLVPEANQPDVIEFVKGKGMACSVYGSQYLLEALYLSGEEEAALALMTASGGDKRNWLNMIAEGSTITMEAWSIDYKSNLDWNHAWGAAPGNIIPRFVAGIRPLEPGFAKALIHPQPASLQQFQIKTPTIRGAVLLSMDKQADNCTFQVTIPANMTAKFVLPKNCDAFSNVTLDGIPVTLQQDGTLRYIDSLGSGSRKIVAQ